MKRKPRQKMSLNELKVLAKNHNIDIKPNYCHDDYMFTSFCLPYPLKDKLDRLKKKFGLSRSAVVQMLIDSIEEK